MATTNTVELEMFTPGTPAWLRTTTQSAYLALLSINGDARRFHEAAKELIEHKAWEIYFDDEPKTWERFLADAIGVDDPQKTISILRGVESALEAGITGAIPASLALSMNEKAQALASTAKPANPNGGDRRSESFQPDNYKTEKSYGTSAEYLTSVIARDHPDVHEAMKAGKYRSVREAAIDAGIVKPRQQWSAPGPVEKLAALIRKRYTEDQIHQLIQLLEGPTT